MRKRRISKLKQMKLVEYFVAGTTARTAADGGHESIHRVHWRHERADVLAVDLSFIG